MASSAVVAGAIIYFFVSNGANQKRVRYMTQVNEILELLRKKVDRLKELINLKEEKIYELEKVQEENEETIIALMEDIKIHKANLEKTVLEKGRLIEELVNWKEMHDKALEGFSVPMCVGAATLLKSSTILKQSKYKPKKFFKNTRNIKTELATEISNLS